MVFFFFGAASGAPTISSCSIDMAFRITEVLLWTVEMAPNLALITSDGYGFALVIIFDTPNYSS